MILYDNRIDFFFFSVPCVLGISNWKFDKERERKKLTDVFILCVNKRRFWSFDTRMKCYVWYALLLLGQHNKEIKTKNFRFVLILAMDALQHAFVLLNATHDDLQIQSNYLLLLVDFKWLHRIDIGKCGMQWEKWARIKYI